MSTLLLTNGTLVSADGETRADVLIEDGIVTQIGSINPKKAADILDCDGMLLLPGLIDCHTHFREPGLEHKATMKTESAAARAGGVTTVCEMPNTIPPTVTVSALADKVRRAADIEDCDIRFFFGATEDIHLVTLHELWEGSAGELQRLRARCCGLKLYLDHSTGDQRAETEVVEEAFRMCGELGIPVVAHCEDAAMNTAAANMHDGTEIALHSQRRPPESEVHAIAHAIELAKQYKTHFHVAHLSTAGGVDLVRKAKKQGLPVTCEVTPHHLLLTTDHYERFGTLAKMNPPLRTEEHTEALWKGIADGTVDCVSSDHAPHTFEEKQTKIPLQAPSGVPGVETMIPLLLNVALQEKCEVRSARGKGMKSDVPLLELRTSHFALRPSDIVRLCFTNPNRIFNLGKQDITEGNSPDIVLIDPKKTWDIRGDQLHGMSKWTPFEGAKIQGKIVRVLRAQDGYSLGTIFA